MNDYKTPEFWITALTEIVIAIVAILVALIRMGKLMSIYPGAAAMAFAAVVVVTMLAAMQFDPRLIWDGEHLNKDLNRE